MNIHVEAGGRPLTSGSAVDLDTFKGVMRKLVGSVTVITTENQGVLHGFTATAVCSVCAEPPTILIVVNRSARTHPHIDERGAFAVNILAEHQVHLANLFATKAANPFADVSHAVTRNGVPVIEGAAAFIECQIKEQYDVGTHTIFIGQVIDGGAADITPLIYQDASYARVAAL